RKMLPPPMTRQISSPRSFAAFTSAAMLATVAGSIPKALEPISASPDSLSKMRFRPGNAMGGNLYRWGHNMRMARTLVRVRAIAKQAPAPGSAAALAFRSAPGGGGDFGSKVALFLLDAFAELEAHEALQVNRRAHILA